MSAASPSHPPLDQAPGTVYELVTRTRLEELVERVNRVEAKVNAILVGVVLGLALELTRGVLR